MNIGIVGGGITGLSAAYYLTKKGHHVTLFEKESYLGGLAAGFKEKGWDWYLERSYHHFFTNDDAIISLMHDLGIADKIITKRPITATLIPNTASYEGSQQNFVRLQPDSYPGLKKTLERPLKTEQNFRWRPDYAHPTIFQLDSPANLLTFPYLSPVDKARTAAMLAFLKLNPFWQPLESVTAENFFKTVGGDHAWEVLWQPLMAGKFDEYACKVAASWLWARIKKRTPSLCYIQGGFQTLVDALVQAIRSNNGKIYTKVTISSIYKDKTWTTMDTQKKKSHFDAILLTIPTPIVFKIVPKLQTLNPELLTIPHLSAQTLILETNKPILTDVYWLNMNDRSFPFLAAVAHTNFMDPVHYAGHHLTYFGNYLPSTHPYLSMTKGQLLKLFMPYIKRLHGNSSFVIRSSYLFSAPFAQPVHELHYSSRAPTLRTPFSGLHLANLDSIYPWDRGTNYAIDLGLRAAITISKQPTF